MNYYAIQQNGVVYGEDMRSSFAAASMFMPVHNIRHHHHHHHRREPLVCPKPRRVGTTNGPSRHLSHQAELSDSKAGSELLEIILAKGGHGPERSSTNSTTTTTTQLGFFSGSPPSRVSNPLIQDACFREEKVLPPINTQPARKGGCVRVNFGNNPVVRVEGFDCLDRDRSRNCRISALA